MNKLQTSFDTLKPANSKGISKELSEKRLLEIGFNRLTVFYIFINKTASQKEIRNNNLLALFITAIQFITCYLVMIY